MRKGLNLITLFVVFFISLVVIFSSLIFISTKIFSKYNDVKSSINSYVVCEKASQTIKDVSNYLTEKARLFIINHERKYVDEYIEEKFVAKRREKAVQELLDITSEKDVNFRRIQIAMEQSESLCELEIYSMRLAFESMGEKNVPPEISGNPMENSRELMVEEKQAAAEKAIFGEGYSIYKMRVDENCTATINDIENNIQKQLQLNSERLRVLLKVSGYIQGLLIAISACFFFLIAFLVIAPLRSFVLSIRNKERLSVIGSREFRFLAETYNEVHEFDALTNILNRRAYEEVCERFSITKETVALLIVDLDNFKQINDNYGHAKGDYVLKSVASNLRSIFRKEDYVARIGGDEFSVICPGLSKENESLVKDKIVNLNENLSKLDVDGVSVSVGMAFSTKGFSKKLYENADRALYSTKESGKRGISVYDTIL